MAFASWPKETWCACTLGDLAEQVHAADVTRTAVIIVGDVLAAEGFTDSYLYSSGPVRRGSGIECGSAAAAGRARPRRAHWRHGCIPTSQVISSLAGRVPDPALPVGDVRIGGFGGVEGLRRWLATPDVDAVVDATHPFAATITANAARACASWALPHLLLARPAWPHGTPIVVGSDARPRKSLPETASHGCS